MNTNVALETTIVEEIQEADVTEVVQLALSDLDAIGGGMHIGQSATRTFRAVGRCAEIAANSS